MREHGQGDPAVPGGPSADLVLVQPGEDFPGLEGFLDAPALPGDPDQGGQRDGVGLWSGSRRSSPVVSLRRTRTQWCPPVSAAGSGSQAQE